MIAVDTEPVGDVETVRERRQRGEDEELEEDEESMEPVGLAEADVVGDLRSPCPPDKGEEGKVGDDVL